MLYLPREIAEIVEDYAPYWMHVGKTTFVQSLNKIHPNNIRDIWADRAESIRSNFNQAPPVVAELIDYYDDLMEIWCADSYAYIPPNMDLSSHQPTRGQSLLNLPRPQHLRPLPMMTVLRQGT